MLPDEWMQRAKQRCKTTHPDHRTPPCDECKRATPFMDPAASQGEAERGGTPE